MLRIQHCLDSRLPDGGEVLSLTHRPLSTSQKHICSSFSGTHFCCWIMQCKYVPCVSFHTEVCLCVRSGGKAPRVLISVVCCKNAGKEGRAVTVTGCETSTIPHFHGNRLVVVLRGWARFTHQEESWHLLPLEAQLTPWTQSASRTECPHRESHRQPHGL
jgi:hypothetical protein